MISRGIGKGSFLTVDVLTMMLPPAAALLIVRLTYA